jgi:hypothetical protein
MELHNLTNSVMLFLRGPLANTVPFEGRIEGFAYRSHADHNLADRTGEPVVIRRVVVRHGR